MAKQKHKRLLKRHVLQVCMSRTDAKLIEARAIQHGKGLSAFIRECLQDRLRAG